MKRAVIALAVVVLHSAALGAQGRGGPQAPPIVSPEVHADRRIMFRITAPDAQKVEVRTPGDIPGSIAPGGRGLVPFALTKNADGVWDPVFVESEGGHTWLNWRDYLSEFAPQLFR